MTMINPLVIGVNDHYFRRLLSRLQNSGPNGNKNLDETRSWVREPFTLPQRGRRIILSWAFFVNAKPLGAGFNLLERHSGAFLLPGQPKGLDRKVAKKNLGTSEIWAGSRGRIIRPKPSPPGLLFSGAVLRQGE
jgi:hypothetical protein